MISTETITIHTESRKWDILISPISLHSKEAMPKNFEKIVKLYLYGNCIDNDYRTNLRLENIADEFKSEKYLINYGQDFGKFYLGSLMIDFDAKRTWDWQGHSSKFCDSDGKILETSFFNPDTIRRHTIIFTPTRPEDFSHGNLKYLF